MKRDPYQRTIIHSITFDQQMAWHQPPHVDCVAQIVKPMFDKMHTCELEGPQLEVGPHECAFRKARGLNVLLL